jgi:superfamily II DNA helicase RecQ
LCQEEREQRKRDIKTGAAQTLQKIQQKLAISKTNEEQYKCIEEAVELVFGFPAKKDQIQSLHSFLIQKEDRILVAKTGYGKSVVSQLLPLLCKDSIVLILLPLNALGAEQLMDIEKLPLANPVWLHADNNDESTLRKIAAGLYTHILVSPEIACSLKFCDQVVSQTLFRKRLRAVVVDEVHLVVDWGRSIPKVILSFEVLPKSPWTKALVWMHCNFRSRVL